MAAIPIPFRSIQRVYFDDLDALNILHNVRFVLFMERARGEFFNALGFRWEDDFATNPDKAHVVAAHDVRYLVPVRGEGELVVEIRPTHLGRSSLVVAARVTALHGSVVYAEGTTRLVRLEVGTVAGDHERAEAKPSTCPWSDAFRARMAPLIAPLA